MSRTPERDAMLRNLGRLESGVANLEEVIKRGSDTVEVDARELLTLYQLALQLAENFVAGK